MFKSFPFYIICYIMGINPNIWIPHLKFTLQTIAITYPTRPNKVTKRKYYDLIHNLPVYFPEKPMGSAFLKLLDDFPVTPYLDSRMSIMKWVHFIFNKINKIMNKPEEEFYESLEKYYEEYKPKNLVDTKRWKQQEKYIKFGVGIILTLTIFYFYKK
jgi:hypothetical protein